MSNFGQKNVRVNTVWVAKSKWYFQLKIWPMTWTFLETFKWHFGGRFLASFNLGLDEQMHLHTQVLFPSLFCIFEITCPVFKQTQVLFCWEVVVHSTINNKPKLDHLRCWVWKYLYTARGKSKFATPTTSVNREIWSFPYNFMGKERALALICSGNGKETKNFATFTMLNETLIITFPHQASLGACKMHSFAVAKIIWQPSQCWINFSGQSGIPGYLKPSWQAQWRTMMVSWASGIWFWTSYFEVQNLI